MNPFIEKTFEIILDDKTTFFYMRHKATLFQLYFLRCGVVAFRFRGAIHCKYKQSFLYCKICLYYKNNYIFTGLFSHELKIRILDFVRPGVDLLSYLFTPWSRVLEKLTGSQLVKKFPAFLEPEGSSPYSQVPATSPYPEPTPSSPHNSLPLPEDPS